MNIFSIERALRAFDVKSADVSSGDFSAYLSVFNIVDKQNDCVAPGAFTKTLQIAHLEKDSTGSTYLFPILYQHDANNPIGGITSAIEDSKGLLIKGIIDVDTQMGRTVISGMKKGYLNSMSIGYKTISSHKGSNGVRVLDQIDLYEGSIVTFPALPAAKVLVGSVKGFMYNSDVREEYTMIEIEASKRYTLGDVADLLSIDATLARNLIERSVKEHRLVAQSAGSGYYIDGSDIALLDKLYRGDIRTNRVLNGLSENKKIRLNYPTYERSNAMIIASLIEGKKSDLRTDRELDDREYFEYK